MEPVIDNRVREARMVKQCHINPQIRQTRLERMNDDHSSSTALPLGWEYLEPEEAAARLMELTRELPPSHILFGVDVETFAASIGDDDTLFRHVEKGTAIPWST